MVDDPVGRRAVERFLAEVDGAGLQRVKTGDGTHQGRLAGAVRADERDDLALFDVERNVPQGLDVAVGDADVVLSGGNQTWSDFPR